MESWGHYLKSYKYDLSLRHFRSVAGDTLPQRNGTSPNHSSLRSNLQETELTFVWDFQESALVPRHLAQCHPNETLSLSVTSLDLVILVASRGPAVVGSRIKRNGLCCDPWSC